MNKRSPITYGISSHHELLDKLKFESDRVENSNNPYDIFNFIITTSVLWEWISKSEKYKKSTILEDIKKSIKLDCSDGNIIPNECISWFYDKSIFPIPDGDIRDHIVDILQICNFTANASKHYKWHKTNPVTNITRDPEITDYYQYFFTSTEDDIYITIREKHYGLKQVRAIAIQFFQGLLDYLEAST